MPSWAKRLLPRSLRSPRPNEWTKVSPAGPAPDRKRRSMAAKTASGSTSPPPDPVTATVTPSLTNAAASSADIDLLYMSLSLLHLNFGDDFTIHFKLPFHFGLKFIT